jgi:superfamily II DNA or RNA helicase
MIVEKTGFTLRGNQPRWVEAIESDETKAARLLVVAPGGIGKSSVMSVLASRKAERGIRTLVTENREHLVEQTAARIEKESGLNVDIEMAGSRASPYAECVVGSVQSLGRPNRLTGFAETHFGQVISDECHFCLAPQPARILNYFHFGAASLAEGWTMPATYKPLSTVIGFTASPDIGSKKNLGSFFQKQSVNYSYLEAIEDGWLVGLKEINIPVTIDTRKFRRKQTTEGADFNHADQAAAIAPIIKELAQQVVIHAHDKKTIAFLPSVDTARMMAETLKAMGMNAIFVSGECLDKSDKTDLYNMSPKGTVLCNCALVAYGVDFVDTDCIAIFSAVLSKANYIQKLYRSTRVLPGLVRDSMTADERRAAIAASAKPFSTVLSPFFVSDRIDICAPYDLFGIPPESRKKMPKDGDLTKTERIRDGITALEKAADKHAHKQARTINPVSFALAVGDQALAHYVPETAAELAKPSREILDLLLKHDIDTTRIKNAGEAQKQLDRLRERDRLGLATPSQLNQLQLCLKWPVDKTILMSAKQAGVLIWKRVEYKPVLAKTIAADDPALAYGEG